MNVLSFIHIHRLPNPSGVGRVIDQLLKAHAAAFPATRHRMLVSAAVYDRCYLDLPEYWKKAAFIAYRRSTSRQQARWVWLNKPLAEGFWPAVDVVYCPAESYVPTRKAKLVCTIHDVASFEPELYPNSPGRRLHCLKWTHLFQRMARSADAVVTVSNFSASRIAHFFPELETKLRVIHNAPHAVFGSAVDPALGPEVARLSGGKPFVLVPGGLSLRKNAGLILEALPLLEKELPEIRVLVAGTNEAEFTQRLDGLGVGNTTLCGYVSDEVLNELYHAAAAVWFPSRYEGFGMPVIEALAAGAPVVASQASSIPEVVGQAAVLCGVDAPREHVEALRLMVSSDTFRNEHCKASLAQAARFTWPGSANQLEQLFRSL